MAAHLLLVWGSLDEREPLTFIVDSGLQDEGGASIAAPRATLDLLGIPVPPLTDEVGESGAGHALGSLRSLSASARGARPARPGGRNGPLRHLPRPVERSRRDRRPRDPQPRLPATVRVDARLRADDDDVRRAGLGLRRAGRGAQPRRRERRRPHGGRGREGALAPARASAGVRSHEPRDVGAAARPAEGQRAHDRPARRDHGREADGGADPALPSPAARTRRRPAGGRGGRRRDRGERRDDRSDRRRDGGAHRSCGRRAHRLRHGQGDRQGDGRRGRAAAWRRRRRSSSEGGGAHDLRRRLCRRARGPER